MHMRLRRYRRTLQRGYGTASLAKRRAPAVVYGGKDGMSARLSNAKGLPSAGLFAAQLVFPLTFGLLRGKPVGAATLAVTNCNDSGSGSLRAAIAIAQSGDTVDMTALTCSKISV